jgi:hypothetical protein
VNSLLQDLRRYWRGRSDRLPPLRSADIWGQVLEAFEFPEAPYPRAAVAFANQHRDVLAPRFLQVLEDTVRDPQAALDSDSSMPVFAMVFLGCWRDVRAWQPLLALARLDEATLEELFGDTLTETYGRALASVCDGDMAPLARLLRDETLSIWTRGALFTAWSVRVMEGDADVAPLEDLALELGQACAARAPAPRGGAAEAPLTEEIASLACDLSSERLAVAAREWFERGAIDTKMIDLAFFEAEFARPLAEKRDEMRARGRGYLRDVEAETGWWATFSEAEDEFRPPSRLMPIAPTTIVRKQPKIGRNDPCPCGSGRKYKKCHGAN